MKKFFLIFLSLFLLAYNVYAVDNISDVNTQEKLIKTNKDQSDKKDNSAIDDVEEYEGESISSGSTFDVGKSLLKVTHLNKVEPPFFDGIDNNVIFSQHLHSIQLSIFFIFNLFLSN